MTGPIASRPLGPLSPSLLEQLTCPLRVAFTQSRGGREWPHRQTTPSLLGDIAHETIEAALRGTEIDHAWTAASESRTAAGIASANALPTARRMRLRIRRRLPALLRELGEIGPRVELLTEHELKTADGEIRGRPDLIACGTETLVVDYKSGLVEHDSEIRASYRRQLLLYGALVHECLGLIANRLLLFSLRQGIIDVPADLVAMQETAAQARQARNDYNKRTPGPQPGHPAPTTCQYCPHAPVCDPFWDAVDETWEPEVGLAVRGHLHSHPENSAWGQSALTVEVDSGPLAGRVVHINGIAGDLIAHATVGNRVAAIGLRPLGEDPVVLSCSSNPDNQRVTVS